MEIKYLGFLQNTVKGSLVNSSIPLSEIAVLEEIFNKGNFFPKSLRELLFIAGRYCVVLDYSICEDQQEMQDYARELLEEGDLQVDRPFYAIDFYSDAAQFLFVYLDENNDDPHVNVAYIPNNMTIEHFFSLNMSLSEFLNSRTDSLKKGFTPY